MFPGHVGLIYQASNAVYLGRTTARTIHLLPDGRVLSGRALQKIRAGDVGWEYAARQPVAAGARPRRAGEDGATFLRRALEEDGLQTVRHPGNHRYAFRIGQQRRSVRLGLDAVTPDAPRRRLSGVMLAGLTIGALSAGTDAEDIPFRYPAATPGQPRTGTGCATHRRRRIMSRSWAVRPRRLVVLALGLIVLGALAPTSASANFGGLGSHPMVFVRCNFTNQRSEPAAPSYWQQMYTSAGSGTGQYNWVDWWHDVSFGQLNVSGSIMLAGPHADANGWYTVNETRETWSAKDRFHKIQDCANAAASDINYSQYWGVVAIYPEMLAQTTVALTSTATTMTLNASPTSPTPTFATTNYFPTPPFVINVDFGATLENVEVTAINNNVLTIVRGQNGTTAQAHNAGVDVYMGGDFGAAATGQIGVTLSTGTFNLAVVILPHQANLTGAAHETGHGYGYIHSRKLSYSTQDYNDSTDVMSAYSGTYTDLSLGTTFGGAAPFARGLPNDKGPGLNAINLDKQGWIPTAYRYNFSPGVGQVTLTMHALGDPKALSGSGYLEVTSPAAITIQNSAPVVNGAPAFPTNPPTCTGTGYSCTTSLNYSLEYREKSGWDSGFPQSAVDVHLYAQDTRSYWIDQTLQGHSGLLYPGDEFVDAANSLYLGVNSINTTSHTAQVTMGSAKIGTNVRNVGPAIQDHGVTVTVSAQLTVAGGGTPVPNQVVTFQLGSDTCSGITDVSGIASCPIPGNQAAGFYNLTVTFAGDAAYSSAQSTGQFDIFSWTKKSPTTSPSARADAGIAQTPTGAVMFGGTDATGNVLSSTWVWNGSTWAQRTPTSSPSARNGIAGAMTYDAALGKVVLFGGRSSTGANLNDTWTWDGTTWTQLTGAAPPARQHHSIDYDENLGAVLLFGGTNGTTYLSDTWELTSTGWTKLSPATSPPARDYASMVFDEASFQTVLFGGYNGSYRNDTWVFDGTNWNNISGATAPPARRAAGIAYEHNSGYVVLTGGYNGSSLSDTWTFDGFSWENDTPSPSPSARNLSSMVGLPGGNVLLFGGVNGTTRYNDTWIWQP